MLADLYNVLVSCSAFAGFGSKNADTTSYTPTKSKYHPVDDACWKRDEK